MSNSHFQRHSLSQNRKICKKGEWKHSDTPLPTSENSNNHWWPGRMDRTLLKLTRLKDQGRGAAMVRMRDWKLLKLGKTSTFSPTLSDNKTPTFPLSAWPFFLRLYSVSLQPSPRLLLRTNYSWPRFLQPHLQDPSPPVHLSNPSLCAPSLSQSNTLQSSLCR